jgi:aryl sulfotransferase
MSEVVRPQKQRELYTVKIDSSVWNEFRFRPGDVIIATYEKAGTTWAQQIVAQLIFPGRDDILLHEISPWLDLRTAPKAATLAMLEAQTHRRMVKTHLPLDAMVYAPEAKYIYVGRDGRDIAWSLYHHLRAYTQSYLDHLNSLPGRIGPALEKPQGSEREFFLRWLREDGSPIGSFWEHVAGWWGIRFLPNILILHYAALKADLPKEVVRIADFLDAPVDASRLDTVLEHCRFPYMKRNAERFAPRGGANFEGGAQTFIHKGTNGRWRDVLRCTEIAEYEETARNRLGDACAHWLQTGGLVDGI